MPKGQSKADEIKDVELRGREPEKLEQDDPKVVYMPPSKGPFRCGGCEYFLEPHACSKVFGHIDANGCCNLFEPADESSDDVGESTSAEA